MVLVVRETLPEALVVPSESRAIYQFARQSRVPVVRAVVDRRDHRTARRVANIEPPDIESCSNFVDSVSDAVHHATPGNPSSKEVELLLSMIVMRLEYLVVVIGQQDEDEEDSLLETFELDPLVLQVNVNVNPAEKVQPKSDLERFPLTTVPAATKQKTVHSYRTYPIHRHTETDSRSIPR
jgi:hypothetical protein